MVLELRNLLKEQIIIFLLHRRTGMKQTESLEQDCLLAFNEDTLLVKKSENRVPGIVTDN
jgi:hypothetical protein